MSFTALFSTFPLLLALCPAPVGSLNILLIVPTVSNSHILYNFRIAQVLANHHNVTLLMHMMSNLAISDAPIGVELVKFTPNMSQEMLGGMSTMMQGLAFQNTDFIFMKKVTKYFHSMSIRSCQDFLNDHELIDYLRSKNFSITLSHFFTGCPAGWSHRIGVKKFAWVAPGAFIPEHVAWSTGLPYISSYIPNLLAKEATDRMNFIGRVKNTLLSLLSLSENIISSIFGIITEGAVFRQPPYHTESDPDLELIKQRTASVFINGEPFLDFPRPLIPGMVHLGQMERKEVKSLPETWQNLTDNSDAGVVLFSFGTVANTSMMPFALKEAYFEAFKKFSNYTIIWRLEGQMPRGLEEYPHIHIVKWIPQNDLLRHKKMKLFITHGGYNSLLESAKAAVPMILVPLFVDQYPNAQRAKRFGIGLILDKQECTAAEIENAMSSILTNPRFPKNAQFVASVLEDSIIPREVAFVRQVEKIAGGNPLWPTMRAAQRLHWIQYSCLDVLFVLSCVIAFIILGVAFCYRKFKEAYARKE